MSSFTNKIDEWMKEAEERPESAVMIVLRPDRFQHVVSQSDFFVRWSICSIAVLGEPVRSG